MLHLPTSGGSQTRWPVTLHTRQRAAIAHAASGALLFAAMVGWVGLLPAQAPAKKPAEQAARVELTVLLMQDKAALWVNDQEVKERGMRRKLTAAPLKLGAGHYVNLKVVWAPNNYTKITRVRKLEVVPGKSYE